MFSSRICKHLGKKLNIWKQETRKLSGTLLDSLAAQFCYEFQAPAKWWQHFCTTYPNIVGPAFGGSGQTMATFQCNVQQHCWAQHVERVWPPCCDMLGIENRTSAHVQAQPHQATFKCCMKILAIIKFEPTTSNTSQQGSQTHETCCDQQMLWSSGRRFMLGGQRSSSDTLQPIRPNTYFDQSQAQPNHTCLEQYNFPPLEEVASFRF